MQDEPSQVSYGGSLILADPSLTDPNFNRTVLLLTEHRPDKGAHGYILNRPLGKTVKDVLPAAGFNTLAAVPLFIGGPVGQEQLTFASFTRRGKGRSLLWATHLSKEQAEARMAAGETIRAFVGYSGWAEGQLENELRHHSWILRKAEGVDLNPQTSPRLWARLLGTMGPYYRLLAATPENPSLN